MFRPSIDLLLYNANVITLDKSYPRANWISSSQGRIHRFGNGQPPSSLVNNSARNVNCHGGTILPGFNDAHCHVLASAASALAVDCGPKRVKSIDDIKSKLVALSGDKKTLIKFGIAFGAVIVFLIIYYAILNPMVNKRKLKLDDMLKKKEEIETSKV